MMRNQTAAFSGGTTAEPGRNGWARLSQVAATVALAGTLVACAGCGKSGEAKITGSRSAPPVSLACSWQPGYTYHLRLDTEIVTETEGDDPQNSGRHRVTYGQECLVRVTNAPSGGNLELHVEITAIEMERAKNEGVALCFHSEQGGETVDDLGYIPALRKLLGGRLRFSVSPGGKLVKFEGVTEWLNNALGAKPAPANRPATTSRVKTLFQPPPGSPPQPGSSGAPAPPAEVLTEHIEVRRLDFAPGTNASGATGRAFSVAPAASPPRSSGGSDTVARTLRGFYNHDLFRMLLEFRFLPTAPVRVGDEWKEQGDTPITSRNNRIKYDAKCTFTGWQLRGGTNCARIDAEGKTAVQLPPNTRKSSWKSGLDGKVWVDTALAFPAITVLDKATVLPGDTSTRVIGTNSIATTTGPKFVREHVTITLLKATPPEAPAASSDSSP